MVDDSTNSFFIIFYPLQYYMVYISCSELSQLVRLIAEHLHSEDLQTILVIPAMMRGWGVELVDYVLTMKMCTLYEQVCYMSFFGDMNYKIVEQAHVL